MLNKILFHVIVVVAAVFTSQAAWAEQAPPEQTLPQSSPAEAQPENSAAEAMPEAPAAAAPQTQEEPVLQGAPQTPSDVPQAPASSQAKDYYVLANYSYLDLILPGKYGATVGLNTKNQKSWELEYLTGYIAPLVVDDLGEFSEDRISLIRRSFSGGSFNYAYGLTYNRFSLTLGDAILSRVTAGSYPSIDLIEIQSLGLHWGVGNRWVWDSGFSFAVDWFMWSQPIYVFDRNDAFLDYADDANDRDEVETALDAASYLPRLTLLKLQAGYSF